MCTEMSSIIFGLKLEKKILEKNVDKTGIVERYQCQYQQFLNDTHPFRHVVKN